jgi:exopolysaccharide biosynthesis polyprenyl glycosylphosphotransferase
MIAKRKFINFVLVLGDICLMYGSLFLVLALRNRSVSFIIDIPVRTFLNHFTILYILWLVFLFSLDFYEHSYLQRINRFISHLLVFSFGALFSGIAFFYLRPEIVFTPKTILIFTILVFDVLFFVWLFIFHQLVTKRFKEKIIIVGFPKETQEILSLLPYSPYKVTAFFTLDPAKLKDIDSDISIISSIEDLKTFAQENKVKSIIFSEDFYKNKEIVQQIFLHLPLKINYSNFFDFYESLTKKVSLNTLNEIWFLEKISRSSNKPYSAIKRFFDIFLSLVFTLITAILFPFIALAIKIDSKGPVLYRQERVGKNRKSFTLYKFRTMTEVKGQDREIWREKREGQITSVGAFLRRFHLDELPQCWSILKGDLSFVGPRPEWIYIAEIFEKEIPFYRQRYLVKPGFTGWAQINFPPSNSVDQAKEKFEYDLYYMKNRSILLDIEIVLKTVRLILKRQM